MATNKTVSRQGAPHVFYDIESYMRTHVWDQVSDAWETLRLTVNGEYRINLDVSDEDASPCDLSRVGNTVPVVFASYAEAFGNLSMSLDSFTEGVLTDEMYERLIGTFPRYEDEGVAGREVIARYLEDVVHFDVPAELEHLSDAIYMAEADRMVREGYMLISNGHVWSNLDKK